MEFLGRGARILLADWSLSSGSEELVEDGA